MSTQGLKEKTLNEKSISEVIHLLDEWQVAEPSPWFDGRMMTRFREEQQRLPQGFFARWRDRFLFGNAFAVKPMLAGAMALLLVAGGSSYLQLQHAHTAPPADVSATVQDLQVLDNNEQAIQQLDQLLDADDSGHDDNL